jgi:UDP-glucose 4-epimerase
MIIAYRRSPLALITCGIACAPMVPRRGREPSDRTILVTGGSGFVGSHVVDRLLAAGVRPRIFDARPSPYHPEVELVQGTLEHAARLDEAMRGCHAVIHLAAAADVDAVEADPVAAGRSNGHGTLLVLEAARRCGVRRVVYGSTVWVYSDTPAECHDESLPLHPPAHLYTATKLAGELYCRSYRDLYGLETTVVRLGIPYGPRSRPTAVVPAFVSRALAGEPLQVGGDGSQTRRFVYVEDLADGIVRALAPVAQGRTYNLVGSEDVSVLEIAETVRRVVGDVEIRRVPGRNGDYRGAPVSGARAAEDLGWRPVTSLEEGVRRFVAAGAAVAAPGGPAPRTAAALVPALLRRAAVALACAAATAVMIIGVAVMAPVDQDLDIYDAFAALLLLVVPVVLAGGFDWDAATARWLRTGFSTAAGVCIALVLLPWPGIVGRLGHGHRVFLVLLCLTVVIASRLPADRAAVRIRFADAPDS